MFENLLVAVDGSECADRALELALTLAKAQGSHLTIASVADPSAAYGTLEPLAIVERVLAQIDENTRRAADKAVAKARAAGIAAEGCTLHGDPAYEIVGCAERMRAGAIVIGTHGRSGLRRLFMGSVAEGVLRSASVPVLTVRSDTALAPAASEAAS
jgi:nucleotide-binding universal stress UspA family protein